MQYNFTCTNFTLSCCFQADSGSSVSFSRGVCNAIISRNAQFTGFLRGFKSIDIRAVLVVVLYVVLGNLAVIDGLLLGQEICDVRFLEQGIALVLLVGQDAFHSALAPLFLAARRPDPHGCQLVGNRPVGKPCKELAVNKPDGLGFFRVYDQVSVLALVVTDEAAVGDRHLAVAYALAVPPGDVFRNAPAFLLGKARHDGDEQLALGIEGLGVFLFKVDLRAVLLELADGGKVVHCVSGETAEAFRDDQVYLSCRFDTI